MTDPEDIRSEEARTWMARRHEQTWLIREAEMAADREQEYVVKAPSSTKFGLWRWSGRAILASFEGITRV